MRSIGIIGAGNLGKHLAGLLCRNRTQLFLSVSDKSVTRTQAIADEYEIEDTDNATNIQTSDIIFLTTKPNHIQDVCKEIADVTNEIYLNPKLIVTTAAGVPIDKVIEWTDNYHRVVRCMPNIAISEGKGSIVWHSGTSESHDRKFLEEITSGPEGFWVPDESLLDPATVISGCSPAYIAKFFDTYVKIGQEMGFGPNEARTLLLNSFEGTLELLREMETDEILDQVASKGGATEKGLEQLDGDGFATIVRESAFSSLNRIEKIRRSL